MKTIIQCLVVSALLTLSAAAHAADGMITVKSNHSVANTADRLVSVLKEKGMTVMARVDHTANAAGVDLTLPATEVVIFGNPKAGTPLMQCARSVAIDLPQKALIWEDESGEVRLGYNDPMYLKQRHGIEGCDKVLKKVSGALSNLASAATR